MNKLILNFKSKDSKKIKLQEIFWVEKVLTSQKWVGWDYLFHLDLQFLQRYVIYFIKIKKKLNKSIIILIKKELKVIEKDVSKKFGDLENPLLLSVRSGARVSMPGMMDTILNLGLNDKTVKV